MSINQIRLQTSQLAELYGQQLVETEGQQTNPSLSTELVLLGDFQKRVLILVNEPTYAYLSDEGLKLLTGILAACQMSMADVGILNLYGNKHVTADVIHQEFTPTAWWIFGLDRKALGMPSPIETNQTISFQQAPVFCAPSLDELTNDPTAKRTLWNQLKNHYGV